MLIAPCLQYFMACHTLMAFILYCAAKIQIFSQTNVKMLRFYLYLQQFNVFSRLSATISPIIRCESKEIPHIMQANFVNASIHFAVYPCTCPYRRCKITSNPPNRPIWFVDAQLWFADAAFFISKHPTSVKNNLHFRSFLPKSLHNPNKCLTFAPQEPAKPLYDA